MPDHETIVEALTAMSEAGELAEGFKVRGHYLESALVQFEIGGFMANVFALHAILEGSWWKDYGVCLEPGLVTAGHKHKAVASGYPLGRAPTALLALCRARLGVDG